ncbi:inter-alpha-trypsin inhibitor heavy chain H3-like isoform X3 [Colossoma macropomum]|uniref:inter-alpha-trypsin inhibitor heavy chain H3-like isoform X3 n=1 Tax=Colossoma macropomum TaxID=42526 RepID=UPI0018644113|nr:inter-alpha-trypsin inhibitor heavy chain H3-like isoform X3 [Colossoma macropomum]
MDRASVGVTLFGLLLVCATAAPTKKERDIDIYSFHINSTVTSRYAITVITSRVANRLNESKEVHFQVKIPKNAFISKFRMTIEGKTYDGVVKQKEEAQQQYSQAVSRGESAGMVSSVGRTLEEFKTSVTVAAFSKVTFELTYEELLIRRLGKYKLLINAHPMQPVADFKVDVYIKEGPDISFLEVKGGLSTNELASAVSTTRSGNEVWVTFYPTREQQTKCEGCAENGLNGDLIITYDVERLNPSGELQIANGYFVHYFSPTDIQRIPKNVVFIIDRSGSMHGRKIHQTRLAMLKILGDLASDDNFGLITFDSQVDVWKRELLQATERNLKQAKDFVKQIQDRGATDINGAVLKGVEMIKRHPREGSASILILLTDGDPTAGETDIERIQANVKEAIGGKFPLYCLGFGFDVNFDFLEKMALENNGLARRIYEDSDADLQLQGFYEEVATPLLTDVQLNYIGAGHLTQTSFSHYYNGSEIVVAGQITDNSLDTFQTEVIAISKSNKVKYEDSVSVKDIAGMPEHENFIQRLWAYLTVKQRMEKEVTLKGEEKEAAKKEALDLSLKYKFVTPLTSMVVTKPHEEDTQVAHKPKEGEQPRRPFDRVQALPQLPPLAKRPMFSLRHPGAAVMPALSGQAGPSGFPASAGRQGIGPPPFVHSPGYFGPPPIVHSRVQSVVAADDYDVQSVVADVVDGDFGPPPIVHSRVQSAVAVDDYGGAALLTGIDAGPAPTAVTFQMTDLPSPPESHVRFLVTSSRQPKPLCYDVPLASKLRLLMDPSSEFSMNGELKLYGGKGFKKIVLHYKTNHHLTISTSGIRYSDGQTPVKFVWGQEPTKHETDSVSLILKNDELNVTMGTVRVVFLLHKKDGDVFLWPAVRQLPQGITLQGILGKTDVQYELLPQSWIKIKDQEVLAEASTATDHGHASAPRVDCWLVPLRFVLQGELSDFTVSRL